MSYSYTVAKRLLLPLSTPPFPYLPSVPYLPLSAEIRMGRRKKIEIRGRTGKLGTEMRRCPEMCNWVRNGKFVSLAGGGRREGGGGS